MSESIEIYAFGNSDRSGKIRWLGHELGLNVIEHQVELGSHRKPEYRSINPFAAIPTVVFRNQTLIESTAAATYIAEQFPEKQLAVFAKDEARYDYLKWISIATETLEPKLVDYILANNGLFPKEVQPLYEKTLAFKCRVTAEQLPQEGYVSGKHFTIADIITCYSLKIALLTGFLEWSQVSHYVEPLMARPAAQDAHFFDGLKNYLDNQS